MVKVLSGANLTNIAATFQNPDILVEMAGISKQWSTKTRAGYETRIMEISRLQQRVNPLGGVAELGDFTVTIQQETPTQFVQDLEPDNEVVEVFLQYGADAKIGLYKGRLDRWELSDGLLRLHCIATLSLAGKSLPIEQILATNFSTFGLPTEHVGRWVPVTIGAHDRALGYLIDKTTDAQKVKFNAAVSGHAAVGGYTSGFVWIAEAREFLDILTSLSAQTAGHLLFATGASAGNGFVELTLTTVPINFTAEARITNEGNAFDEDFTTFATYASDVGDTTLETLHLRHRLRAFPFPETITVLDDQVYILIDVDRILGGNLAGSEACDAAIELINGTYPAVAFRVTVIGLADDRFDNLNDMTDVVTALPLDTSQYASSIGLDLDGDSTAETLPVARLSDRNLALRMAQQNAIGISKEFKIHEFRLRVDMKAEALTQIYLADLQGYDDDASGTYTGTANQLIENPADVVHFILAELLGLSGITTADFTQARTDLGGYTIAGQVFELTDARKVLNEIAREGKLKIFIDLDDQWAVKAYTVPGTEDRHLQQDNGDFVGDDESGIRGEIRRITQSPLDELYNQFEILYQWNAATQGFDSRLVLDETTSGPIGDWLTESQSRYNLTRKLTVQAKWIRTANNALSYGNYLIYMHADRKRIVEFQTSFNGVDLEIGDRVRLTHSDLKVAEDTTVFAGYRAGSPLAVIQAGYIDPDTSAVIKAGAKVELNEGRHQYEIYAIDTSPLEGKIRFTGRQVDFSRSPLSEPI